jgi:hypothetical protein
MTPLMKYPTMVLRWSRKGNDCKAREEDAASVHGYIGTL